MMEGGMYNRECTNFVREVNFSIAFLVSYYHHH